jgi:hypothetical protein
LAAESKDRGSQAWLLAILADLSARRSALNVEQVEADYRMALELAQELRMCPLQARCRRASTISTQVKNVAGRSELGVAVDLYKVMSMYWLSKAEARGPTQ